MSSSIGIFDRRTFVVVARAGVEALTCLRSAISLTIFIFAFGTILGAFCRLMTGALMRVMEIVVTRLRLPLVVLEKKQEGNNDGKFHAHHLSPCIVYQGIVRSQVIPLEFNDVRDE